MIPACFFVDTFYFARGLWLLLLLWLLMAGYDTTHTLRQTQKKQSPPSPPSFSVFFRDPPKYYRNQRPIRNVETRLSPLESFIEYP